MGLIDKIKNDAKKVGSNKGKFVFFPEGKKVRVRFLTDMDDGIEVVFHDNFEMGVNVPCQEQYGRDCKYCDDKSMRTRSMYAWSVYDYESKEVKIMLFAVNNCSPVPALMAMYENYGTLLDRDFVLQVAGKQQNRTFSVIPQDKNKFRNAKVKPLSDSQMMKIIDKAYPDDSDDDDEYEEETTKKSRKNSQKPNKNKNRKSEPEEEEEDDYDNEDWEDEENDDEIDYSEMTAKELYKLCKERDIDVVPKKSEKYYIKKLEEYDEAQEDWGDEDEEDDEWEE